MEPCCCLRDRRVELLVGASCRTSSEVGVSMIGLRHLKRAHQQHLASRTLNLSAPQILLWGPGGVSPLQSHQLACSAALERAWMAWLGLTLPNV